MKESTFRRYSILGQLGLFLLFFLISLLENIDYFSLIPSISFAFNYTFMITGVVGVHYFYLLPLYLQEKRLIYFISLFLVMTVFIVLSYFIDAYLCHIFDVTEEISTYDFWDIFYDYLLLSLTIIYTSLYYFVEQWFKNNIIENRLRNEKLQAELNFLKSQINPHFLFNTLNNIYSYAQTGNKKTAPMLERLSSILRFMVYDCSENRVGLSKEITAVEDLLEIHKMKNSKQQNIELVVEGVKRFHLIAPLIIVNFVENACKHSDVVSNKNGFIKVKISVDTTDNCLLKITNTFKEKTQTIPHYGGLGLENIKKRLELQYNENYSLKEEKLAATYNLELNIPLERKQ